MPWYGWLIWGALQVGVMVWVWIVVRRVLPPEMTVGEDNKTDRLLSLYQRIEEMLDSFEEFVGETHERLDERRTELIELNRQAQVVYMQALEMSKQATAFIPVTEPEQPDDDQLNMLAKNGAARGGNGVSNATQGGTPGGMSGPAAKRNAPVQGAKGSAAPKGTAVRAREPAAPAKPSRLTDLDREALGRFVTKPQKVRFLMSRGLSLEEVARELDIGKGEVILIADLDK